MASTSDLHTQNRLYWLLSAHIFGLVSCVIFLILTIYRFYYLSSGTKSKTKTQIRLISILNITFYTLFYFINIFIDYFQITQHDFAGNQTNIIYIILIIIAIVSASLAPLLFYLLLVLRLKQTFKNTIYKIPIWLFRIYIICIILMCFIWGISWITDITPILNYDYDLVGLSKNEWSISQYIIGSILIIMNIIFGTSVTYLFIKKLFHLIIAQQQSIDFIFSPTTNIDNNQDTDHKNKKSAYSVVSFQHIPALKDVNAEFNPKQLRLLRTITKHTILVVNASTFYQFALIFGVLQQLLFYSDGWDRIVSYFTYIIATIIEILCIFLSFKVNHSCYLNCCSKCHICTEDCCYNYAKKSIINATNKNMDYLRMHAFNGDIQNESRHI